MIKTETTKNGISVGMSGAVGDIMIELAFVLKEVLKHVPENQRVNCLAEIGANALLFAKKDETDGEDTTAVRIENADVLADAIDKIIGGIESNE